MLAKEEKKTSGWSQRIFIWLIICMDPTKCDKTDAIVQDYVMCLHDAHICCLFIAGARSHRTPLQAYQVWQNDLSLLFGCTSSASYYIRKIVGCACTRNTWKLHTPKTLINDPGKHHGMRVTHVPWCMSVSLTRGGGENVLDIPGACATRNFTYLVREPFSVDILALRLSHDHTKISLYSWGPFY